MSDHIRRAISLVVDGHDLSEEEAADAMDDVMSGRATPAQIAGFAVALRMKGETVDEVTGAVRVLREKVTRVDAGEGPVVDTAGTGGDRSGTFNISTTAALLAAAAGAKVAKHGNRSVSSRSGSADVLTALGVRIDAPVPVVERSLREARIGFLFAPALHPALGHAGAPRRELGVRTLFNILGPLANPAFADCQVVGVFHRRWVEPLAQVLLNLGTRHAWVVHGHDGLDELTLTGPSLVAEAKDGKVRRFEVDPTSLDLEPCKLEVLLGEDADANARITRFILEGEKGPRADVAALNAAAALVVSGLAEDLRDGIERVRKAVADGEATAVLERLVSITAEEGG